MERFGLIEMGSGPVTLMGNEIKLGDKAPDFTVSDKNLKDTKLSDFKEDIIVISVVPSIDTPTCDIQTRKFNKEATSLGKNVKVLTISMDLPFAQSRWCGAANVEHVVTLSDYKNSDFGMKYGLLIKEVRLLARAVLVLDKNRNVKHFELEKVVKNEPNYADAMKVVKSLH